jgi:hypothetical protein
MYVASSRIALDPNAPFSVVESVGFLALYQYHRHQAQSRFEIVYCPYSIDAYWPLFHGLISLP